jgi:hypothetical protein
MFVIEDEAHAEPQGRFETRQQALVELQYRAAIPWNEKPNRAPCSNWRNCGRRYEIIEYDHSTWPPQQLSRDLILLISAVGVRWILGDDDMHIVRPLR